MFRVQQFLTGTENWEKIITPSYTKRVLLLHIQHTTGIQKKCTSPARPLFAVGSYFLSAPLLA